MGFKHVAAALEYQLPESNNPKTGLVKAVLIAIADRASDTTCQCYPSRADIERRSQVSESTVKRAIPLLESYGVLKVQNRKAKGKKCNESNLYTLNLNNSGWVPAEPRVEENLGLGRGEPRAGVEENLGVGSRRTGNLSIKPVIKPVKEPVIKAHTIPEDFTVTDEMKNWFIEKGFSLDIQEETEEFIEYWKSEGGKKKNWHLTWKNRMRDQQKRYGANKSKRTTKARPENFTSKDYGETKVNF